MVGGLDHFSHIILGIIIPTSIYSSRLPSLFAHENLGVSINGGSPKWMTSKGNPIYKWMNRGTPYFRKPGWVNHLDGRNPASVNRWFIPLFTGFQPSKANLFHPPYHCQLLTHEFGYGTIHLPAITCYSYNFGEEASISQQEPQLTYDRFPQISIWYIKKK